MATLIAPSRHGRPNVSETMTASSAPVASRSVSRMPPRRGVRVEREQHDVVAAPADVRGVDAGVGADEAVARLRDEHAALHADDAHGLAQDDLDGAGVLLPRQGEVPRLR